MQKIISITYFFIISALFLIGNAEGGDKWPMYQGNSAHTGFAPVSLDASKFALRWSKQVSPRQLEQIILANGRVYTIAYYSDTSKVISLDANTGVIYYTLSSVSDDCKKDILYSNDTLYVLATGHNNYDYLGAYNANTGNQIFNIDFGFQYTDRSYINKYNNYLYISDEDYSIYSLDRENGNQNWSSRLPYYHDWSRPSIDEGFVYTYAYEYSPGLYVFDRMTGQLAYQIPSPVSNSYFYSRKFAPVLGGLCDALAIDNRTLIRFDLEARNAHWAIEGDFFWQPTVANGVVYAVNGGALGAYDQRTGDFLWMWEAPGAEKVQGSIIATNTHVFLSTENSAYCIDLSRGREAWSYPAVGELSLGEGALYIAGANGMLTAISLGIPDLSIAEAVAFDNTGLGGATSKSIPLTNLGDEPVEVRSILSTSNEFSLEAPATPFTLAPHQSASIVATFSPRERGMRRGAITIESDDPNEPEISATLTGLSSELHCLTASAWAGGAISPAGKIPVYDGDSLTFAVTPDPGYRISEVLVDGAPVGKPSTYTFSGVTTDRSITAKFTAATYHEIEASAGAGGRIEPSGRVSIADGDSLTLTVTPNPRYLLLALLVDGTSVGNPLSYTLDNVTSSHAIAAVFAHEFDYFGMQTHNRMEFAAKYGKGQIGTETIDISLDASAFPFPVYLVERSLGGVSSASWYQVSAEELFLLRQNDSGSELAFDPALLMTKKPQATGAAWTAETSVSIDGRTGTAMLTAKASPMVLVSVPAGSFLAYPIAYTLKISGPGQTKSSTSWKEWLSPCIGPVKTAGSNSNIKSAQLTSFSVGEGTVSSPPPIVTSVSPKSAEPGKSILIKGFQFGASQGASSVRIGGVDCAQVLSWTDNSIECVIPESASSGAVTVITDAWTSNDSITIKVTIPPVATDVLPAAGKRGTTIQILGRNFGTAPGTVKLGNIKANVRHWGDGSIICVVPMQRSPGACPVAVTNSQGRSVLEDDFTVIE